MVFVSDKFNKTIHKYVSIFNEILMNIFSNFTTNK